MFSSLSVLFTISWLFLYKFLVFNFNFKIYISLLQTSSVWYNFIFLILQLTRKWILRMTEEIYRVQFVRHQFKILVWSLNSFDTTFRKTILTFTVAISERWVAFGKSFLVFSIRALFQIIIPVLKRRNPAVESLSLTN